MSEMVKGTILYVGNFQLPDKGASANRVVSNGKIFNKLGYQVAYLGVSKEVPAEGVHPLDLERHMYEEAYPRGNQEWLKHMISVENIETMVKEYSDIKMIILYNAPYTLLASTKKAFAGRGVKVVYDCTEWTGVTDGSLPKRVVKKIDEHFIRNMIHKKADGLIVISSMMEKAYKSCEHLIKLPPLIDLNDSIWHQAMEKDDTFEFCFAGMLDGNKDSLDIIVDAYGRLLKDDVRLRIIGVTEDEFCTFYERGSDLLKQCKNEIVFMGRRSHEETIKYVANCDCYIFIRQSDMRNNAGFPTKFSEAFTCGVPMIATDISDIKVYMNESRGQVLESLSTQVVEQAIEQTMIRASVSEQKEKCDTFHYENYIDGCRHWMERILM